MKKRISSIMIFIFLGANIQACGNIQGGNIKENQINIEYQSILRQEMHPLDSLRYKFN